ncbi:MAG: hypothetical protein EXX96DRAFT_219923 [Benjaminiella poitrasii]|nr:MAG: hypothetical protein EXX96DRAFT_219923 [Benjaminiella poitrasii]
MDSMRRAYQKAVTIPLNNVEHLWKEYDQWENNLNRLTAKKFLSEKSSAYMTARTALREMRLYTDSINTNTVALPPQWTSDEMTQLNLWKKYIEWEKNDPLRLEDEAVVMDRVAYAYQQAFLVLRLYPEMWYSFASYYQEHNKIEKAISVLKQGIEILPTSLLLHFYYVEICESKRQLDDVRQAYDQLLNRLDEDIDQIKKTAQEEIDRLQQEADQERASMNLSDDIDGELREQLRAREREVKREQETIETKMKERVEVIARACSLVWINYMRFARRTEGIKSARALFSRARKAANSTYHVYVADALMEYHNSKDATIAGKVFSLGQKTYGDHPDFICQYLEFLIQMNDDNNTRALFERTLATMPAAKAVPIWLKFLDYENKYGDLASVQNIEKRRIEALANPNVNLMESFLKRYCYLDIHNIEEHELGVFAKKMQLTDATGTSGALQAAQQEQQQQQQQMQQQQQQQQQQHQQQSGNRENQKRPLLEPVHPERYPRPDFGQWQSFKPSARPTSASPIVTTVVPSLPPSHHHMVTPEKQQQQQQQQVKLDPMMSTTAQPQPSTPNQASLPLAAAVAQPPAPVPVVVAPPSVVGAAATTAAAAVPTPPTANWNTAHMMQTNAPPPLPDAVAYFVSNLPPAQTFNGPMIPPGELVDLLRNIIIPLPPQQQQSPHPPAPVLPPQQQPRSFSGGGNKPPSNRGGNYNNNRPGGRNGGGYSKRSGGGPMRGNKSGMKRRNRDDYDDDYQSHKGNIHT